MHILIVSIRSFGAGVHLCWFSTYYHSHALSEKPFKISRMPTFGTDEGLSILYLPFVPRTPSSGGKKYLRRTKISIETFETRKRYDICGPIEVQLVVFFYSSVSVVLLTPIGSPGSRRVVTVESSSLLHRGRFLPVITH